MAACSDSQCEPQAKRQRSTEYGMNPGGIIIARDDTTSPYATCNLCRQRVLPGQRIMHDDSFDSYQAKWWDHLECARLELFGALDESGSTISFTSTETKKCAWCAHPKVAGKDQVKGSWMGWVHAHCDVVPKSELVTILRRLQYRHPASNMPYKAHSWENFCELCNLASEQIIAKGLPAELQDMHIKQEEPSRLPIVLSPYVATPPAKPQRWASMRDETEADSDAELSLVHGSGAFQSDDHSATTCSHSASESDEETLGARANRHRAAGVTRPGHRQQHRAAPTCKHRHRRRAGPSSYRAYEADVPVGTARQVRRQLGRTENLGDEDSGSEHEDIDNDSDGLGDFIVPDSDTDDDNTGDAQYSNSGDTSDADDQNSTHSSHNEDIGSEEDDAQDCSNEKTQEYAPVLVANATISVDINNPKQSDSLIVKGSRSNTNVRMQQTQPYAPWESPVTTSSLPLARDENADGVIDCTRDELLSHNLETPSTGAQLVAGCRRLCKRPQRS